MYIDNDLEFGKFKGLTIRKTYQGSNYIVKEFVEKYLNQVLKLDPKVQKKGLIGEMLNFEISKTLMRATPFDKNLNVNYSKFISEIFNKRATKLEREVFNDIPFEEGILTDDDGWVTFLCNGNPEYINWCIKTIKSFFLTPKELNLLQLMPVFQFKEMEVIHKIEDIYIYKPHFISDRYTFPESTIEENNRKFQENQEREEHEERDFEDRVSFRDTDYDRDNFNAMTDGQLGSYDDFEGNSDDVNNWAGR